MSDPKPTINFMALSRVDIRVITVSIAAAPEIGKRDAPEIRFEPTMATIQYRRPSPDQDWYAQSAILTGPQVFKDGSLGRTKSSEYGAIVGDEGMPDWLRSFVTDNLPKGDDK